MGKANESHDGLADPMGDQRSVLGEEKTLHNEMAGHPSIKPHLAAIIPAAGFSSRMGVFKPLLPVGDRLAIEKPILAFKAAGIETIIVVTGHKSHLLEPVLKRHPVEIVVNAHYKEGMFSSVRAGALALQKKKEKIDATGKSGSDLKQARWCAGREMKEIEAFFILPADTPLVNPDTITLLASHYVKGRGEMIFPRYHGKTGHPPLFSTKLLPEILTGHPEEGLRSVIRDSDLTISIVDVEDSGILQDMDVQKDYEKVMGVDGGGTAHLSLSVAQCRQIHSERGLPQRLVDHMETVADIALLFAEHLNSRGARIHLDLLYSAALLHDIAKGKSDHAGKGRAILEGMGYDQIGVIIGEHMNISHPEILDESALLYLADKMISGSTILPLAERCRQGMAKYADHPEIRENVRQRFTHAEMIRKKVEETIQRDVYDLIDRFGKWRVCNG